MVKLVFWLDLLFCLSICGTWHVFRWLCIIYISNMLFRNRVLQRYTTHLFYFVIHIFILDASGSSYFFKVIFFSSIHSLSYFITIHFPTFILFPHILNHFSLSIHTLIQSLSLTFSLTFFLKTVSILKSEEHTLIERVYVTNLNMIRLIYNWWSRKISLLSIYFLNDETPSLTFNSCKSQSHTSINKILIDETSPKYLQLNFINWII